MTTAPARDRRGPPRRDPEPASPAIEDPPAPDRNRGPIHDPEDPERPGAPVHDPRDEPPAGDPDRDAPPVGDPGTGQPPPIDDPDRGPARGHSLRDDR